MPASRLGLSTRNHRTETQFKAQFTKALAAAFDTERPLEVFELYLQEVIERCRPRRILLMLDEFRTRITGGY